MPYDRLSNSGHAVGMPASTADGWRIWLFQRKEGGLSRFEEFALSAGSAVDAAIHFNSVVPKNDLAGKILTPIGMVLADTAAGSDAWHNFRNSRRPDLESLPADPRADESEPSRPQHAFYSSALFVAALMKSSALGTELAGYFVESYMPPGGSKDKIVADLQLATVTLQLTGSFGSALALVWKLSVKKFEGEKRIASRNSSRAPSTAATTSGLTSRGSDGGLHNPSEPGAASLRSRNAPSQHSDPGVRPIELKWLAPRGQSAAPRPATL